MAEDVAEIGPPPITDEQRDIGVKLWDECKDDLEVFNVKLFPNSSGLKPFGRVQTDSIAHDQSIIESGGRMCRAEPRGFGKTTRGCNSALWGIVTGRKDMIPVFSANLEKSKSQIMSRWKSEILGNELLFWMCPELIWPLRALENKPQRCAGQTYNGHQTRTEWKADRIVFPSVDGVLGAGAILVALPLKSCRGATHTTPAGTILRPDFCIFDDVQRDEDADNPNTVTKLTDLIDHTALMLGGHSSTMSAVMNCTVRRKDDLSETYLRRPGWRRVRFKMLESKSDRENDLWLGEYADIRQAFDPESPDDQERAHREALGFYKANRVAMDSGAVATWEWAYAWADAKPTEISAIQHAYNILIDLGESVFASECQNEPLEESCPIDLLPVQEIMLKTHPVPANIVPLKHDVLTAMIDVHEEILDYEVWAYDERFGGAKVLGGTWPKQKRDSFNHKTPPVPLSYEYPNMTIEARLDVALDDLFDHLLGREWTREDDTPMRISRCLVDCNGSHADSLKKTCRNSEYAAIITPSFGMGITAKKLPISRLPNNLGRHDIGPEWAPKKASPGEIPAVIFDANYWKTRFHKQLSKPKGEHGSLVLHGGPPETHKRSAEAYRAERPIEVTANGRTIKEWQLLPSKENHPFDCAVGCMVAASMCGVQATKRRNVTQARKRKRRTIKV